MHCLIVRGNRRTVVRRLGLDTRLNGRTFGDAELLAGDRLSFGPVELEVVASPPPAGDEGAAREPAAEVQTPPGRPVDREQREGEAELRRAGRQQAEEELARRQA